MEWIGARLYGSVGVDDFAAAFVVGGLVEKCVEGLDVRSWGLEGFACGGDGCLSENSFGACVFECDIWGN